MKCSTPILQVAVPSPLMQLFDYLPPADLDIQQLQPGSRVLVPFGKRDLVAIIIAVIKTSELPIERLKPIKCVLDSHAVIPPSLLKLCQWCSQYYHYPIGEVLHYALPTLLRKGHPTEKTAQSAWRLSLIGEKTDPYHFTQSAGLQQLLHRFQQAPLGLLTRHNITADDKKSRLRTLQNKGLIEACTITPCHQSLTDNVQQAPQLTPEQQTSVDALCTQLDDFGVFLLHGVTGSGKTEVYFQVIQACLAQQRQVLMLVPEISLTPQTLQRLQQRFAVPIATLHSKLSAQRRLDNWIMAKYGHAPIVLGTRSAIFTPLKALGLIIIDEEHDGSFKQQDRFRFQARDVAIIRARAAQIPVILGSATPSLESMHNVEMARYHYLTLPKRASNQALPKFTIIDVRKQKLSLGLSQALIQAIRQHLDQHQQVLIFLNRRGYAPVLICHACGWVALCRHCDAKFTVHFKKQKLICHHCDYEIAMPVTCQGCRSTELRPIGYGTERIAASLASFFSEYPITRIDRDTMGSQNALNQALADIHQQHTRLIIGTQMLAKGHHFPHVTLVAILDADAGLFSTDFRATETMAQLIIQVAGRAGRGEQPGQVVMQTRHPDHPMLQLITQHDYGAFCQHLLRERKQTQLPPYSALAMLRAESTQQQQAIDFLDAAKQQAQHIPHSDIQLLGPIAAPMARRAKRYHAQLLIQSTQRKQLQKFLSHWYRRVSNLKKSYTLKVVLDVDPLDLY